MTLEFFLRANAAACLAATALRLATRYQRRPASVAGALLCCGLIAYLAAPHVLTPDRQTVVSFVTLALATANPPLIWLFARGLFREQLAIGLPQIIAAASGVVVNLAFAYALPTRLLGATPLLELVGRVLPHGLALLFVLLAILEAQREKHSDLVEPRRRLRVLFVTAIATYAAMVAVVETALRGDQAPVVLDLVHIGLLTGASLAAAVLVFRHGDSLLEPDAAPPLNQSAALLLSQPELATAADPAAHSNDPPPPAPPAQFIDPLLPRLEAWIARQGFLEPDQTIAQLARLLGTQEYKLRRLLNGQLGFRNFNDFLHRHRVRVACERLTCSGMDLSILTLSMDVGYRSLATFNRAFKELTGVSPSEYRASRGRSEAP